MIIKNEFKYDFDITGPKVTATDVVAIVENVKEVRMISDTEITVNTGRFFVVVKGNLLVINEIWEGRMEVEGKIQGVEIYKQGAKL